MEPILSNVARSVPRNEPHDLLARLYREIGISAVAAALQISPETPKIEHHAAERRAALLATKAA